MASTEQQSQHGAGRRASQQATGRGGNWQALCEARDTGDGHYMWRKDSGVCLPKRLLMAWKTLGLRHFRHRARANRPLPHHYTGQAEQLPVISLRRETIRVEPEVATWRKAHETLRMQPHGETGNFHEHEASPHGSLTANGSKRHGRIRVANMGGNYGNATPGSG